MNNWNSLADFIYMNGHGYYVWCRRIMREARAAQSTLES